MKALKFVWEVGKLNERIGFKIPARVLSQTIRMDGGESPFEKSDDRA